MAAAPAAGRLPGPGFRVCTACFTRSSRTASRSAALLRSTLSSSRKLHAGSLSTAKATRTAVAHSQSFIQDYFSANTSIERGWIKSGMLAAVRTISESPGGGQNTTYPGAVRPEGQHPFGEQLPPAEEPSSTTTWQGQYPTDAVNPGHSVQPKETEDVLPHRKRKRRKPSTSDSEESLPLDASSQLTTAATALPKSAVIRRRLATYLSLTKPRLSVLIILTTASAYSLYPIPDILSSTASDATSTFSTSTLTLFFLTSGTFLSCACANTLNMLAEPKYDALMSRTRNRPLVRKLISSRGAAIFAILCGTSGL